jgi:citronellyl-CoA synthetase
MKINEVADAVAQVPVLLQLAKAVRPRALSESDCLAARLEATATRFPERTAVMFEGRSLTWLELNALVNRHAAVFRQLGLQRGDVVSLMMENRVEFLATVLGLNKLGVTAALINTNLTGRPLAHCIRTTQSSLCVFGEESLEAVAGVQPELFGLESGGFLFIADAGVSPAPEWAADFDVLAASAGTCNPPETANVTLGDTALYLFTSGTTGLPKAAVVSNRRLLQASVLAQVAGLQCHERDVIYLCLPLYHGTGFFCGLGAAVCSGAAMFIRRRFSASSFLPEVRTYRATCFVYIGELCRYLVNSPERLGDDDNPLHKAMGNGLRPDIWPRFKQRFGIARIAEFYGSSEGNVAFANILNKDCTVGTTTVPVALVQYDVDRDEIIRDRRGRCIESAPGEPGLLLGKITDKTVFEGYTSSAATEQKILRNALRDGDAWFNTGDLMKTVDVGFALGLTHYQFVDRVGDTFRWKSENVSTSEVGEIITSHPDVAFCNVYGVEIPGADGRAGMAALLPREGLKQPDLDSLSAHIMSELPAFARPVFLRLLGQIDTTGTFKMVKGELRSQGYDAAEVTDPLYVLKPGAGRYELLDNEFLARIRAGEAGY